MIVNNKISIGLLMALISVIFLGSCQQYKDQSIIYKKDHSQQFDSITTWLEEPNNFHQENYQSTFYEYYDQKIREKKYKEAAKAMEFVSLNNAGYFYFDQRFLDTLHAFERLYKDKVEPINSTFIYTYLGDYYINRSDFPKAIENFEQVTLLEAKDYTSYYRIGDSYRTISTCYYSMGNQKLALETNFKALEYINRTDNLSALLGVHVNFSNIYMESKDVDNAIKSINTALKYAVEVRHLAEVNVFVCLFNKINIYDHTKQYDKMYPLIDSTYQAFQRSGINDTSMKVSIESYYNIKLLEEGKFEEAKIAIDELKPEIEALNSAIANLEYDVMLATYEIKVNSGIKDTGFIEKMIPVFLEKRHFAKARDCYATLLNDAIAKKNFERALDYRTDFEMMKDSIGKEEMTNKVVELNAQYQADKKEQQIAFQQKSLVNKNTTIALLFSALIGFVLLVLAVVLRQKQRKLKIEKAHAQMYTKQLLEKTEEERKRIASDLHDSVSHELLSLKNSLDQKSDQTDQKIDQIINDIRSISRNLHPIMFDKVGLKATINQLVERAQTTNGFMVTAEIDYQATLSTSVELQIYRIIQEALSNIIKYAEAVAAKISITEDRNSIYIEIKDNGKGFDVNEVLSNSNSFGLHNIIERSRVIGGSAKIYSDKKGTIITVEIKKNL